jgi:hypothetical protein
LPLIPTWSSSGGPLDGTCPRGTMGGTCTRDVPTCLLGKVFKTHDLLGPKTKYSSVSAPKTWETLVPPIVQVDLSGPPTLSHSLKKTLFVHFTSASRGGGRYCALHFCALHNLQLTSYICPSLSAPRRSVRVRRARSVIPHPVPALQSLPADY